MVESVHIVEDFGPWMEAAGLKTFKDFYEKPVGDHVSRDRKGRELRRFSVEIEGVTRKFFFKRIGREPVAKLAQMILFGHRPNSGPLRELRMLEELQQAGFVTMRQVAYGEKHLLGWPFGGFLVVEGVEGTEVADLVGSGTSTLLHKLFLDLGNYLGNLHRVGFYQVVRFKDLFCQEVLSEVGKRFDFVLIDRETSKPWKQSASKKRCFQSMARTTRRILRDGYHVSHENLRDFFNGYLGGCKNIFGKMTVTEIRREFFLALRKELTTARR